MNNSSNARPLSVLTPRSMRVYRPENNGQTESKELHFSKVFNELNAQKILSELVKQLMNEINGHVVVTSTIDKSGVNLVLSSGEYQISVLCNNFKLN